MSSPSSATLENPVDNTSADNTDADANNVDATEKAPSNGKEPHKSPTITMKQLRKMRSSLTEKDDLIGTLTERLEQAAEQLDRLHRIGADRGRFVSGGGLPQELVDSQQSLTEQLSTALEQWEQTDPTDTLSRIESQLRDIRELVQEGGRAPRWQQTPAEPVAAPIFEKPQPTSPSTDALLKGETADDRWAAMKARLLGDEAPDGDTRTPPPSPPSTEPAETVTSDDDAPAASTSPVGNTSDSLPEPELPEVIDLDAADRDSLALAVLCRDEYIGYLLARLRNAESRALETIDWEVVNKAPDELRERLTQREEQLDQKLREAELALSIERARLGRERRELDEREARLSKSLSANDMDTPEEEFDQPDDADLELSKSWLGFLVPKA